MIHIGGQFYQRTLFSIAEGVRLQDSWLYTLAERKGKKKNLKTLVSEYNMVCKEKTKQNIFKN